MTFEGSTAASNSIARFFPGQGVVLFMAAGPAAKLAELMQFCRAKVVIVETRVLTDVLVDVKVTVGRDENKELFSWLNSKNLKSLLCGSLLL